jgi:hypothetical protein
MMPNVIAEKEIQYVRGVNNLCFVACEGFVVCIEFKEDKKPPEISYLNQAINYWHSLDVVEIRDHSGQAWMKKFTKKEAKNV